MKIKKSTKHEDLFRISSDVVAGRNENSIMISRIYDGVNIDDFQMKVVTPGISGGRVKTLEGAEGSS